MTLQETVEAAKAEGMSYGEYVTRHSPPVTVDIPKDTETKEEEPSTGPPAEGVERTCPHCGKTFRVSNAMSRQKYCSSLCQHQAQYARSKKRKREKTGEKVKPDTLCPVNDQTAKSDAGKARLSLVPTRIIFDIARIREYGNAKYGDPDNWKTVSPERYRDAAFRHLLAYIANPEGKDEESGLPHLWHLACNVAFLCELEIIV